MPDPIDKHPTPSLNLSPANGEGTGRRSIDFSQRAVKLRLFALVCAVMIVLVLMFEARKPDNWKWMGFEEKEAKIDTRYLANIYPQQKNESSSSPSKKSNSAPENGPANQNLKRSAKEASGKHSGGQADGDAAVDNSRVKNPAGHTEDVDEFQIAEDDFWKSNYRKLNFRQRMLLLEGLYLARNDQSLDDKQATEWLRMAEEFAIANERYQADILQYVTSRPETDPERIRLTETVFKLQERWERFGRIFQDIGNRVDPNEIDKKSAVALQHVLDQTMLTFVEDNSLQSFVNDQPAMFRLIEKLQLGSAWSREVEPERVLFTHLYKETDRLRGKPVAFEGTIRGAYSAQPTANFLGVEKLYVCWIQMQGAQNPVAVYSLKQPKDFVVNLDDHTATNPAELRQPVKIEGVLFQKMVYAAEDGQRIAPVVFTDIPDWMPEPEQDQSANELPGLTLMVGSFLAAGGVLAVFTWIFVSFNNRKHAKRISELKGRFEDSDEKDSNPKP